MGRKTGDGRNKLKLLTPSSWWGAKWREALPAGNGITGAAVYGGVHLETVMLTHGGLWWQSRTPELPDVSGRLGEMRRLMMEGQEALAENVLIDGLKEQGYDPVMAVPLPLGDLNLSMEVSEGFKDYSRELDMETGEITVRWQDGHTHYERALFVSRTDDLIVYSLRSSGPDSISAKIGLDLHHRGDVRRPPGRPEASLPTGSESGSDGEFIWYAACHDNGSDFGAVVRVVATDGRISSSGSESVLEEASKALILVKLFVHEPREAAWKRLKRELAAEHRSYDELRQPHMEEHGGLFHRMTLSLDAPGRDASNEELLLEAYRGEAPLAMLEKMWAYGRYLLIASSREGGDPCHLYGLWCGEYRGFWAFHMANENLQMIYWQALAGHMPELLLPVFDYVERQMDDYRGNARRIYGCRGIWIPAPTAPDSGLLKTIAPHIIHWTGAAGWIAQHYYDYYLYTGDREFLRNRALPFLREAALFYEDFLITGDDGLYISFPSNSPENRPGNGAGGPKGTTMNATMDFAIAKEVLTRLVEGAAQEGLYAEEMAGWKGMIAKIPPYQVNADGAVREWMHPAYEDQYHHRHQSHLYPVFPGKEVTHEKDPGLFAAFVTAVRKRLVVGLKEQTGWSLAHMSNLYARMGEADKALECLDLLGRSAVMNNFFTLHNDWRGMGVGLDMEWAPFQIDANMGLTAAVQEMLLYSDPSVIRILPALPDRFQSGNAAGMLACGGYEVDIAWDRKESMLDVKVRSVKSGGPVTLVFPEECSVFRNGSRLPENRQIQAMFEQGESLTLQLSFS
ncbi:glycoside hydrolase N-terminal domain-containing protein [Paenibacillus sp. XY044]|uniref:glycosyl hydrolase family 95 catalytic domain-containing protein n=1 Tax=Paenibacillus sp. XY044 TaxID=2026089 RepID=UPI000B97E904|nr:glycoside hydrolase N-terminal domain-containing protein [Paenibacillus sp. XY044]OZB98660.1 alpha-L-fucosidase [Paenibacillus sp. XY044]